METIENNKLIAEFMNYAIIDSYGNHKDNDYKYHSDWNWLMPVVEKIEFIQDGEEGDSIRCHKYDVEIKQNMCTIIGTDIEIDYYSSKIENVYRAVVEFIEYYNQQKP